MASLLPECLFDVSSQAPAPSKDFYQLVITKTEVIVRWWKISLRSEFRDTKPGELRESHQDFLEDSTLQVQISIVFGQNILEYVSNLCRGKFDFLERLPEGLLLYIMTFLDLEDIARLSQTSHTFEKVCSSDKLWEHIVESLCDTVTPEMRMLAQDIGWKQIFFTNKLQLQLQLRRRRKAAYYPRKQLLH
ncbi:F-box only protein 36 [Microcaecilia unicolor]|uniref:F-box only protein 36 n=1 Tax=Microcaecilia unicolor TaxID=1415580 RepID=A0A6P7YXV2_9AMPH|nr:F-box only protein 36 [Microcaecilia unicolor]